MLIINCISVPILLNIVSSRQFSGSGCVARSPHGGDRPRRSACSRTGRTDAHRAHTHHLEAQNLKLYTDFYTETV